MKILHSKKGMEDIMSPIPLVAWVVVGIAVVLGVALFVASKQDITSLEAEVLAQRMISCLEKENKLLELMENPERLISGCEVRADIIKNSENFYIKLILVDPESQQQLKAADFGNSDIEMQCELKKNARAAKFGSCADHQVYLKYENQKEEKMGIIRIFTGVNDNDK